MDELIPNGLYYSKPNTHNLQPCTLFRNEAIAEIEQAADEMERLFVNVDRSIAAQNAADEFRESLSSLKSGDRYSVAVVERRYRAFLFEWRLYTEHWKKYINKLKKQPEGYAEGYKKLLKDVKDEAYKDDRFILTIVLRNYAAHASSLIEHCHVDGYKNTACVRKSSLEDFLRAEKRSHWRDYIQMLQNKPDEIDLVKVADDALACMDEIQEKLMDYQLDERVIKACTVLLDAKKRIDELKIEAGYWWLFKNLGEQQVLDYRNGLTLTRVKDAEGNDIEPETHVLPRIVTGLNVVPRQLNWIGYDAMASYLVHIWKNGKWEEI